MTDTFPEENEKEFLDNIESINIDENLDDETELEQELEEGRGDEDYHAVLVALQEENAELKDKALRATAEVQNIRKRTEKERADTAKYAVTKFARDMIGVSDNLRRALDAISDEHKAENEQLQNIFIGVEGIEKELLRAFDSVGIKKIIPMDEPFNANFHEVMFEVDSPDKTPGHVIEVLEPGYIIHDRLLRPARVGVAKKVKLANSERVDEEV